MNLCVDAFKRGITAFLLLLLLTKDLGLPIVEFPSTSPRRMIPACQKVYDSVTEATLTHDGSPL